MLNMDKTNWVIKNKLMAGACPRQGQEKDLKNAGITVIVNLMDEKLQKSAQIDTKEFNYIHVGINDHFIMDQDEKLLQLVTKLLKLINKGEVVFIHCLGGHGRTAILSVILLAKYEKLIEKDAIEKWQSLHAGRLNFGKHGAVKSPQYEIQFKQIHRILSDNLSFNTIFFYDEKGLWGEFSNFYPAKIFYNDKTYPTSEHAFQAQKFKDDSYQEEIRKISTPGMAAILGRQKIGSGYAWRIKLNTIINNYPHVKVRSDWDQVKDRIMYEILIQKFIQHERLFNLLLMTHVKKLVEHTSRDNYWGDGGDGTGRNQLGVTLVKLRRNIRKCLE